ncbi:MAG TPA: DUF2784 domain-containing protein [Isosphaeraceae bacterium]|nr:DUF2784 domain-containing protein [Isosphaeraceae bacterium]
MEALAAAVLVVHLAWILWAIAGALWTNGRPWWTAFHVASLIWGIIVEIGPWPCPLTLAEQWLEARAGMHTPTQTWAGGFLVHYLEATIYPDLPAWVVTGVGVAVCVFNLGIYVRRFWKVRHHGSL